jgi:hypothetical protein
MWRWEGRPGGDRVESIWHSVVSLPRGGGPTASLWRDDRLAYGPLALLPGPYQAKLGCVEVNGGRSREPLDYIGFTAAAGRRYVAEIKQVTIGVGGLGLQCVIDIKESPKESSVSR